MMVFLTCKLFVKTQTGSLRDNMLIIARALNSLNTDINASSQTSQLITDIVVSSQTLQHYLDIANSSWTLLPQHSLVLAMMVGRWACFQKIGNKPVALIEESAPSKSG